MELLAGLVVLLFFALAFAVYGVFTTHKEKRNDLVALAHTTLRIISLRVEYASGVHYSPPHDGPSHAVRKYTSPNFSCTASVPHNYPKGWPYDPAPLAYAEGHLGSLDKELLDAVHAVFPTLRDKCVSQIRYIFQMSNDAEKILRIHRGLHVVLEIEGGDTQKIAVCDTTLSLEELADGMVDALFRKIVALEYN